MQYADQFIGLPKSGLQRMLRSVRMGGNGLGSIGRSARALAAHWGGLPLSLAVVLVLAACGGAGDDAAAVERSAFRGNAGSAQSVGAGNTAALAFDGSGNTEAAARPTPQALATRPSARRLSAGSRELFSSAATQGNLDLNGDGKADLLWYNAATGQTTVWLMNGTTVIGGGLLLTDPNFKVIGSPDLNGDGKSDLLWYNAATGQTTVWLMNGTTVIGGGLLLTDPNFKVIGMPDLNGDGVTDLLWHNAATGQTTAWLMKGTTVIGGGLLLTDPNFKVIGTPDMNGDGMSDLLWYNAATGQTTAWLMNGTAVIGGGLLLTDPNFKVIGTLDLNGDGKSDLLWYSAASGQTTTWLMNGTSVMSGGLLLTDPNFKIASTIDLNGDGKSDLQWYSAATGQTTTWLMSGTSVIGGGLLLTHPDFQLASHSSHSAGSPGTLYVGYYAEDPITNPEDPTVGALYFQLPAGNAAFSGAMYFTYVGCQSSNVGVISGAKTDAAMSGNWNGSVDDRAQSGAYSGNFNASGGYFAGTYTVAGGKQFRDIPGCIQYFIAPNGSWEVVPTGTSLPSAFKLSVSGTRISWTSPIGTQLTLLSVIDESLAISGATNATRYQTISGAGAQLFDLSIVGALAVGRSYVVTVATVNGNRQRTGITSVRMIR